MTSSRLLHSFTLAALLLALPAVASAQMSRYFLPAEPAILETHVDLQYQYSNLQVGPIDANRSILSLDAQIALGSVELGVNIPFVTHGWPTAGDSTEFGNIMLGGKWRVFGLADNFSLAIFANAYLPTHSSDFTRKFAVLQGGAVAGAQLLGFHVGGGLQTAWTFLGDDLDDSGLVGFYAYGRFPLLGLIALNLDLEYFNSIHPNSELNAFLVTPGIEVNVMGLHAGFGARIATNDDAKWFNFGRAALLANAGFRW